MSRSEDQSETSPVEAWSFNANDGISVPRLVALDDRPLAQAAGRPVTPVLADLLEVVEAVHVVDRSQRRCSANRAGVGWSRSIRLRIGVRDPEQWNSPAVQASVVALLQWLTDDTWDVTFVPRKGPKRASELIRFLFEGPADRDVVALHSGGLDSLAGISHDIGTGTSALLLSVQTNSRVKKFQRDTRTSMERISPGSTSALGLPLHLSGRVSSESSHRTRGFGFLVMGAALASLTQIDRVRVYENGPGAINLPYSRAQVGAHSTRSMHPHTLRAVEALVSLLTDRPLVISNPNLFRTKSEMCESMPAGLHQSILQAPSCDVVGATRTPKALSCGYCTSCVLRRQALWAAGLGGLDSSEMYRFDIFGPPSMQHGHMYNVRAMLGQASRIKATTSTLNPWNSLCGEFCDLEHASAALSTEAGSTDAVRNDLVSMYSRYAKEWLHLPFPNLDWFFRSAGSAERVLNAS